MLAVCGGLMRTGSVNMFQVMREIAESRDAGYAPVLPLNHEEEFFVENVARWAEGDDCIVVKMHLWRDDLIELTENIKVIVTIRDMRDVVVSLMNFREGTFESSLHAVAFRRNIEGQAEWEEKVPKENLLIVKYEDFIHHRVETTERVAGFMGVPVTRKEAHDIERKWNLSANLRRASEDHPANSPDYMAKRHISSGRDNQWKAALDEEQIQQIQDKAGHEWFKDNGYKLI